MDDSHVISLVAKLSTSRFWLLSTSTNWSPSNNPFSVVHCHRTSQLLHELLHAAPTQSDQPPNHSPLHVLWAHWTARSYSKVAIPLKYNLTVTLTSYKLCRFLKMQTSFFGGGVYDLNFFFGVHSPSSRFPCPRNVPACLFTWHGAYCNPWSAPSIQVEIICYVCKNNVLGEHIRKMKFAIYWVFSKTSILNVV